MTFSKDLLSRPIPKMEWLKPYHWKKDSDGNILLRKKILESYKARKGHCNLGGKVGEQEFYSNNIKEELLNLKEIYEQKIAKCKTDEESHLSWMMNSMGALVDAYRKRSELNMDLFKLENKLNARGD